MGLSRILKKVNKATQAVRSIKGIQAKIRALDYDGVVNSEEMQAAQLAAQQILANRKTSFDAYKEAKIGKSAAKAMPPGRVAELQYPLNDPLENHIVFTTRPRIVRASEPKTVGGVTFNSAEDQAANQNLLSKDNVEIRLYVPDELNSTASVQYATEAVGSVYRGGDVGEGVAPGSFIKGIVQGVSEGVQKFLNAGTGNNLFLLQGKAVNPMQEQMLKGVDFRPWSFNYIFFPKSAEEAEMVNRIIYYFRTAMLPDTFPAWGASTANSENFFNYPNIFDVEYQGPIATKLDGFLPMVCTQCNVNHAGGLKFSTYHDGQPIKTTMQLAFLELKILTQESYQELSPLGDPSIKSSQSIVIEQARQRNVAMKKQASDAEEAARKRTEKSIASAMKSGTPPL